MPMIGKVFSSGRFIRILFFIMAETIVMTFFFICHTFGVNLFRTYWNGESAIGFWITAGFSFALAYGLAVVCSTYDIFCWFCCGNGIQRHWRNGAKASYPEVAGFKYSKVWLIAKGYWVGETIYRVFVPQADSRYFLGTSETFAKNYHFYLPLIMYGAWPGGVWTGVGYSISHKLNQPLAFAVLSFANAVKMLVFGLLSIVVSPWLLVPAIFTLPFLKKRIEKRVKRFLSGALIPQPAIQESL
jgi:hypothetical protein